MSSNASQLIFELHKGQAQFAYFQLGVSASAIAFAIHETSGLPLSDAPWPLGVAVALWAISFAIGCFGIDARQDGIQSNARFLQIFGDILHRRDNPEVARVLDAAQATVKDDLKRPIRLFGWQKWLLFIGALFYIAGHIMQMAEIPTKPSAATAITGGQSRVLLPKQHPTP
jgi:hypothetical protein